MNLEEIKKKARNLYKQGTRLDNKGQRPQRVEKVLHRAISLDPFNLAYHRRFICYLIKKDRVEEAREAWERAIDLLRSPDGENRASLYKLFHKEIAVALMAKNEYVFVTEVLKSIPENILRKDEDLVLLVVKLTKLTFKEPLSKPPSQPSSPRLRAPGGVAELVRP